MGKSTTATETSDTRARRPEATVEGDRITGTWWTEGDTDVWRFEGTRHAVAPPR